MTRAKGSLDRTGSSENSWCVAVGQPMVGTTSIKLPAIGTPGRRLPVWFPGVRRLMGVIAWQASMRVSALARFGKRTMTSRMQLDPFTTTSGIEGTGLAVAGSWWTLQSC